MMEGGLLFPVHRANWQLTVLQLDRERDKYARPSACNQANPSTRTLTLVVR